MHIEIQNCFSFWRLRPPDPLPGLRPWTPLGDFVPQTPCTGRPPHFLPGFYAPARNMSRLNDRLPSFPLTAESAWNVLDVKVVSYGFFDETSNSHHCRHHFHLVSFCAICLHAIYMPAQCPWNSIYWEDVTMIGAFMIMATAVIWLLIFTRLRFARDLWRFTNVLWLIDWL